jgi:radical SAM superfamily enzyme YgiQ (UPF0313 family)
MKVLLCTPNRGNNATIQFGIAYIVSYLRQQIPNVEVKIVDETIGENIEEEVFKFQPNIVGISALTPHVEDAYRTLDTIKRNRPDILTVIGGVHSSALPNEALKHADIVVVGAGEKIFTEIVKAFSSQNEDFILQEMIDVGIIEGSPLPIEDYPEIPFDLLKMEKYIEGYFYPTLSGRIVALFSSFHCNYACPFCYNSKHHSKPMFFSTEYLVKTILFLHEKYNVNSFYMVDDDPLANIERLRELSLLFEKYKINSWIKWTCQTRVNTVNVEVLSLIKKMGCVSVAYGLESGNQRMLSYWKNNTVKLSESEDAIKMAHSFGLKVIGTFIVGWIDETEKEIRETYNWILNQDSLSYANIGTITPFPATKVWEECERRGIKLPIEGEYSNLIPTTVTEKTLLINQTMKRSEYFKLFNEVTRVTRLYSIMKNNPSYSQFFKLGKVGVWCWVMHPTKMVKLLLKVRIYKRLKQ